MTSLACFIPPFPIIFRLAAATQKEVENAVRAQLDATPAPVRNQKVYDDLVKTLRGEQTDLFFNMAHTYKRYMSVLRQVEDATSARRTFLVDVDAIEIE